MRNTLINLLKWPVVAVLTIFAFFAAAQLPAQVLALLHLKSVWIPLVCGILFYAFAWRVWLRTSKTAAWSMVLEHELTHVLASLVTFNGVHRLQADSSGSGHIAVNNSGNWIILVAPYVLPTALLVPGLLIAAALPGWFCHALFGFAFGFHVHSTCAETHLNQTDLKKIGWPTAALLLPACHVIFALLTVGVLLGNQNGMSKALRHARVSLATTATSAIQASRP